MILSRRLVTLQTGRCPTEPLCRLRRQLPFQESLYGVLMPPQKREVPAVRAVGFANEEVGDSNLWFPNSSIEPAAASGSGHCPAATPTSNPQGILRIRRNQPLQSMAAGFVFCPAAASACRLSLQRPPLERFLFDFITADLQPARFESTKVLYTDSMEK